MKTANGVEITHGLRVWDNDLACGSVDLSSLKSDGWFDVVREDGRRVLMNAERVTTVHPFSGEVPSPAVSVGDMQDAVDAARRAASGDSNDEEIDALHAALTDALTRWPEVRFGE